MVDRPGISSSNILRPLPTQLADERLDMICNRLAFEERNRVELRIVPSQQFSPVLDYFVEVIAAESDVRLESDRLKHVPNVAQALWLPFRESLRNPKTGQAVSHANELGYSEEKLL